MTEEPKHEGSGPALESLFNLAAVRASADAQPISPEEGTRRAMRCAAEAMKGSLHGSSKTAR